MTIGQFLVTATRALRQAGIDSARLDVLLLLEAALQLDRSSILAHQERELSEQQITILDKKVMQRETHMPMAYIRGEAPFFGRDFMVDAHVLVPRPETESMITLLKRIRFDKPPRILDIGTGSGCIGITAALEIPGSTVASCDIDDSALAMAKHNAERLGAQVRFYRSDLLNDMTGIYDTVLANLPYVPEMYPINKAAGFEPKLALFSGKDGLEHYRRLWHQLSLRPAGTQPRHIITEALPAQHQALENLARATGYLPQARLGYAQHFEPADAVGSTG